ncbi:GTP-binding protein [Boseaceae bacterium BT-24-1]|nr:GTP-binding protein [Boseaceae bacterium BT-24-1]
MAKLKATILTGFLGAGKTTLLNNLLSSSGDERIAVIVNEYGEVGIDGKLVVETRDDVIELNNGCICCTVRADLITTIQGLLTSGRPIDRLIIETSGLADPAPVIQSFMLDEILASRVQIDAIVTVVDACYVSQQLSLPEAQEQISFADLLLLNKIDLVSESALDRTEVQLRSLNPLAKIVRAGACQIDRSAVLDISAFDLKNILSIDPDILSEHEHEHDSSIGCVAIREPIALDPAAFNMWMNRLVQSIGKDLLRVKGVLNFADEPRRYVFHGVHMTLEGRPGRPWLPAQERVSEIVFIGRNLDETNLRTGFRTCLAEVDAVTS